MKWFRRQRELLELKLILEQDRLHKEAFDFWIRNTGAIIPPSSPYYSTELPNYRILDLHIENERLQREHRQLIDQMKKDHDKIIKTLTMTRQDYIEAIRNGEYCIESDDPEVLRTLLKEIFPRDPAYSHGGNSFYFTSGIPYLWAGGTSNKGLKSIKASILANMKDETVIKITPENMQRIIDIACATWKDRLAHRFANNIVLKLDTFISQSFYQEMRSACTPEKHTLFDEIFGPEFKAGDFVVIDAYPGILFECKDSKNNDKSYISFENTKTKMLHVWDLPIKGMSVRHATPEEIRVTQYPPDGTPCWVWAPLLEEWILRYANGGGSFYMDQKKSGALMKWEKHKPFDPNNLPFNE